MPDVSWEVSETDKEVAREGVATQAGLYLGEWSLCPPVQEFLEHQITVIASLRAENRFLSNIVHQNKSEGENQ